VIFACAACGAISPRRYRSEPGASNKRPNSDGRGYGAAFNAARDQLLANKPMCAKGCGTLADTAQHNPSAGRYGRSGRRQHRVPRDALLLVPGGRDRCTGAGPYLKVRRARRAVDGPSNTRPIGALPASTLQRVLLRCFYRRSCSRTRALSGTPIRVLSRSQYESARSWGCSWWGPRPAMGAGGPRAPVRVLGRAPSTREHPCAANLSLRLS
jgi:hypothetical protein